MARAQGKPRYSSVKMHRRGCTKGGKLALLYESAVELGPLREGRSRSTVGACSCPEQNPSKIM